MSLETESAARLRKGELQRALLGAVSAAGVLAVAMAAPNTVRILKHAHPLWVERDPRRKIQAAISKMKRNGLIVFDGSAGKTVMRLTKKGEEKAHKVKQGSLAITRPKKWDGRWRVIVFDIPESRRYDRQRVRHLLLRLGFHRMQNSVWVHPYDCEEIIVLLKTEMRLGRYLLYMIVDAIEHDVPLREVFGLT